jgi:hypothetical protein
MLLLTLAFAWEGLTKLLLLAECSQMIFTGANVSGVTGLAGLITNTIHVHI